MELWQWFRDESLKEFNRVYDMMGISFDSYNGESFYSDKMPRFVQELKDKGLLVEDNGAQIVRLDDYDLPPALITKIRWLYALYNKRYRRCGIQKKKPMIFIKNIYVVASQQNLHFQQWIKSHRTSGI